MVMIGWVFFRAADLGAAFRILAGMAGLSGWHISPDLAWQVAPERLLVRLFGVVLVFALPWLRRRSEGRLRMFLISFFLWAVATLSSQAFMLFLYFLF